MGQRATAIELTERFITVIGEPMVDTSEGTLIITYEDSTYRVFNWDFVVSYYYMSEEETARAQEESRR